MIIRKEEICDFEKIYSFDVPDENFMAYKITENVKDNVCGTIKYAKEFGIN